jgi:hypothetical protein
LTRRDNQNFRLRAPFFAAIITAARHQILIQIDHRFGRVMNANIAEYYVPVNADVYDIKVIFLDDPDSAIRWELKGWARSASSGSPQQSPTRFITRPESECATCRSRSTR